MRTPEELVPHAMLLVGAVRDGGPSEVREVLHRLDPDDLPGLAVVLAAMVDPGKPPSELLGWVPDELPQQIALWDCGPEDLLDRVAIERACKGERVELTKDERLEVVRRLHADGVSDTGIAKRLHASSTTVARLRVELGLDPHYAFGTPAERRGRQYRPPDEPDLRKWTDEQVLEVSRLYRRVDADKGDPLLRAAYLERERRRAERYRSSLDGAARSA